MCVLFTGKVQRFSSFFAHLEDIKLKKKKMFLKSKCFMRKKIAKHFKSAHFGCPCFVNPANFGCPCFLNPAFFCVFLLPGFCFCSARKRKHTKWAGFRKRGHANGAGLGKQVHPNWAGLWKRGHPNWAGFGKRGHAKWAGFQITIWCFSYHPKVHENYCLIPGLSAGKCDPLLLSPSLAINALLW